MIVIGDAYAVNCTHLMVTNVCFNAAGHYKQKTYNWPIIFTDLITISPHIKLVIVAQPVIFKPL